MMKSLFLLLPLVICLSCASSNLSTLTMKALTADLKSENHDSQIIFVFNTYNCTGCVENLLKFQSHQKKKVFIVLNNYSSTLGNARGMLNQFEGYDISYSVIFIENSEIEKKPTPFIIKRVNEKLKIYPYHKIFNDKTRLTTFATKVLNDQQ